MTEDEYKEQINNSWIYKQIINPLKLASKALTAEQLTLIIDVLYKDYKKEVESRIIATSYLPKYDIQRLHDKKVDFG
jgi:hypothetical protein